MKRLSLLLPVLILLVLVMFILPFFSSDGYSIIRNTTSELGAQQTRNSWIMNTLFILLGLSTIIETFRKQKGFYFIQAMLFVFGSSLILAGIFHHAPISPELAYNMSEDNLHSIFAGITGFSFTLAAISSAFILNGGKNKLLAVFIGITATLISGLMFTFPHYSGIFQRIMFLACFGWLSYIFSLNTLNSNNKPCPPAIINQ